MFSISELVKIIKEGKFKVQSLYTCDECFLTNSLVEILPVKKIDSYSVGNGAAGKTTKALISAYKNLVNNLF